MPIIVYNFSIFNTNRQQNMKFYQQNYFKPYHKLISNQQSNPYIQRSSRSKEQYDSKTPQRPLKYSQYNQYQPNRYSQYNKYESKQYEHNQPTRKTSYRNLRYPKQAEEPVWEHLYQKGMQSQKELLQKYEQNINKMDEECTFTPSIRHNKRYYIPDNSNFFDRMNIWQETKIEKIVKEKEEEVNRDLKECTFAPHINPKSKNYKKDSRLTLQKNQRTKSHLSFNMRPQQYFSPLKERHNQIDNETPKRQSAIQLKKAKQIIRSELRKILL